MHFKRICIRNISILGKQIEIDIVMVPNLMKRTNVHQGSCYYLLLSIFQIYFSDFTCGTYINFGSIEILTAQELNQFPTKYSNNMVCVGGPVSKL